MDASVVGREMLLLIPICMLVSEVLLLLTHSYLKKLIERIRPETEKSNFTPVPWLSRGGYSLGVFPCVCSREKDSFSFKVSFQEEGREGLMEGG